MRPRPPGGIRALTEEHRYILSHLRCLIIEAGMKGSEEDALETFERLRSGLRGHFGEEEAVLYMPLGLVLGKDSPIGEMIGEHRSIQSTLEKVGASLKSRRAYSNDLRPMLDSLERLVRGHIDKEERVLFWLATARGAVLT